MILSRDRRWLIVLTLVLLGAIFLSFDHPPAPPPVTILPPTPLAVKSGRVPDRWIPRNWNWLRRVCWSVLGHERQVDLKVEFSQTAEPLAVLEKALGQPQTESNGVAVWMVPESILRRPKDVATTVFAPEVTVNERRMARMTTSGSITNYQVDLFPLLEKETLDLSTRVLATSNGQTNFVAALRAHIPYGKVLLLLDIRHPEAASSRLEILIRADESDPAGNWLHAKPPSHTGQH